jgi:CheY-like chemotaxis protein
MEMIKEADYPPRALSSGTGILVVDDNPDARELLCTVLHWAGYDAIGAADGVEALRLLTNRSLPALIFLDILMPHMDGFAVVAALRANTAFASIPVILISAGSHPALRGLRCLQKPISPEALLKVAREFCEEEPARTAGG